MKCRHCGVEVTLLLADLGSAPYANAYLTEQMLHIPEKWFPLRILSCESCWLVQTEDVAQAEELFSADYAYFSGFSNSWLQHCEHYVADMIRRFGINEQSHVIEVATNDGSLLQYVTARNIPCTGIEPTASTANAAKVKGINIIQDFFGSDLARQLTNTDKQADLMIANNVLAHVPNINDFVAGFTLLLKPHGVATFEFPHLLRLISGKKFDTMYHEHFSYLSLTAVQQIFIANGLTVFDVEEHPIHGSSLRVFAQRTDTGKHAISPQVQKLLQHETQVGITNRKYYLGFQNTINQIKNDFLRFLLEAKRQDKTVAAYGAAAKGNTLINYAGIRPDLIAFVVDRNPAKQGKFLPGSHIPIVDEQHLTVAKPDYIIILPWNFKTEIMEQLAYIKDWQAQFVTAIPKLQIYT
ncbi:SAM-dependent methyltransferase [Achromatium sp. WMS3]|nr:SAM-dependent methyltransferase [Achromatium sp. WMS3]